MIGIDVNAEMLALARRHAPSVAGSLDLAMLSSDADASRTWR